MTDSLTRVVRAWRDEGPNPEYHRRAMEMLRVNWPTLYYAVQSLVDETENIQDA